MSRETFSAHLHVEWWGSDAAAGCRLLVAGVVAAAGHQICPAVTCLVTDRSDSNLQ